MYLDGNAGSGLIVLGCYYLEDICASANIWVRVGYYQYRGATCIPTAATLSPHLLLNANNSSLLSSFGYTTASLCSVCYLLYLPHSFIVLHNEYEAFASFAIVYDSFQHTTNYMPT